MNKLNLDKYDYELDGSLNELLDKGLIEAVLIDGKLMYKITKTGLEYLKKFDQCFEGF